MTHQPITYEPNRSRAAELERRAAMVRRFHEIAEDYRANGNHDGVASTLRILEERQELWALDDEMNNAEKASTP